MTTNRHNFRRIVFACLLPVLFFFSGSILLASNSNEDAGKTDSTNIITLNGISELSLETAQEIALSRNPSLEAAVQRLEQARQRVYQARAPYWPRVDADLTGARNRLSPNARENSAFSQFQTIPVQPDVEDDRYATSLSAIWTLFDGFSRKFATSAARFGASESRNALLDFKRLLLSSVAQSYYQAQLALENIRIAEADKAFNRRQAQEARAREQIGTGSLSDVLNFQVQVNNARSNLIEARQAYQVTLYGLAELMGVPGGSFPAGMRLAPLAEETSQELRLPSVKKLISYATSNRPDYAQKNDALKSARKTVGVEKAAFYPQIDFSASLTGERDNSARFEEDDFGNTIGITLSYNLFAGGLHKARVAEARHRVNEAEKSLDATSQTITAQVRAALTRLSSAQAQLELQRSNADLVRRNRDLVEKEYAAGQTSLVRLNEAQRDLTTARGRLALALVSLRNAWLELNTATGKIGVSFFETYDFY